MNEELLYLRSVERIRAEQAKYLRKAVKHRATLNRRKEVNRLRGSLQYDKALSDALTLLGKEYKHTTALIRKAEKKARKDGESACY